MRAEVMQTYAEVFECLFLLVRPHESVRGTVDLFMIIARNSYTSSDEMYVINSEGISFDLYVPFKNDQKGKSVFEAAFRNAAEVLYFVRYYFNCN
jgi:hypothetical protein